MTDHKPSGGWRGNRGTRHERGYGSTWDKLRKVIIARDMGLCQPCKRQGILTPHKAVDHITPKAKGGTDEPDNLECVCTPCHAAKTTQEGAQAKGYKPKRIIGPDGWPVE